ncbi:MAG: metal-sensing transcriptional repressor [Firmicutes bacterium]|nr:metal-sensing transcriptional repressor [Bacillota bacterium]
MNDKQKKAVLNRLARAVGHMEYVKRMVEEDRDPSDVLIQLSAVKSAINSTGIMMIEDQVDACLEGGNDEQVRDLLKAMEKYCR